MTKSNDRVNFVKINATANIITTSRFVFAVAMLFFKPFSFAFWVLYSLCGISDIIDGIAARITHSESRFGEMLDSTADLAFAMVCAVTMFTNVSLPTWLTQAIAIIALIKVVGYTVGFYKHHRFHSPHTVLNKTVGLLLFLSPLMYVWLGLMVTGAVLCPVSMIAATQELLLSIRGDKKI